MNKPFQKRGLILCGLVVITIWWFWRISDDNKVYQFANFNNETGVIERIIPNFVHYVVFGKTDIDFITFLSIISVLKIQRPEKLFLHTDTELTFGKYKNIITSLAQKLNKTSIERIFLDRPTHVFGIPLSSVWHASDIGRILVLRKYGGIYLDTDQLILQPLDKFRHFELVIGWPENRFIGNQLIIAHRDSRFLKLWLESYVDYKPRLWYYNAGELPTNNILEKSPELVHRVKELFGVKELHREIWSEVEWIEWREFYSIHLLSRHSALPFNVTDKNFHSLKIPFRDMANMVLYDIEPKLTV